MSSSVPYRSVVGTSGPAVAPLSDPDKCSITGHPSALPRGRQSGVTIFPAKVCQMYHVSHSESYSSCSAINQAVAFAARPRPLLRTVASSEV